ncbi:MAG: NAD(P)H-dependent oxidoreductase subunit E, partial [Planctomycetota bacterium]
MSELDLTFVDETVERIGTGKEKVLEILQAIQGEFGYLPKEGLERVCELTEITPAAIAGVSTFYNQFRHRPAGRHIVNVCVGTACHVKGAQQIYDAFRRHLDIPGDDDTDADRLFTIEKIACLGCCTLAPAVQIGQITYGHLTPDSVGTVLTDYLRQEKIRAAEGAKVAAEHVEEVAPGGEIRIGLGSCCVARGSGKLQKALDQTLHETGINVPVKRVGCVGMCYQTPLLEIVMPGERSFLYAQVEPEDARAIVLRHFKMPGIKRRISSAVSGALDSILTDQTTEPVTRHSINVREGHVADFLGKQVHIATEHCGVIDPVDLDEYLSKDGFSALRTCIDDMDAEQVISEIEKSGLRGRGGAGFPTHLKWTAVRNNKSDQKYIVCNGDEGDPGAFMDRMLMESYPYRLLEGMVIAAHAVGADEGYLYIRAEYPLAIERVNEAIERCEQRGLLGDNIMNSRFSLSLKIKPGAGAFVCGEESALLASIEGRRGTPRLRPPFPAERGLWEKPTLINNVETYSAVPWIIRTGSGEFANLGTG